VRAAEDVLMETAPIRMSSAGFWKRRGFLPSKDDQLVLFRSIADIAASIAASTA
jgi:hypothetical protein